MKKILIASDHGGYELKKFFTTTFIKNNPEYQFEDLGTQSSDSVDYPDYAESLCQKLKEKENNKDKYDFGVLICGSGQGMAMRANRYSYIRAALCWNEEITKLSRAHNNANVLCLGGRFISSELGEKLLKIFLTTPFEGGRHEKRVNKLSKQSC